MKNFEEKIYSIENIIRISDKFTPETHYNFGCIFIGNFFVNGYFRVIGEKFNLEISGIKLFLDDLDAEKYFYIVFQYGIITRFLVLPKEN